MAANVESWEDRDREPLPDSLPLEQLSIAPASDAPSTSATQTAAVPEPVAMERVMPAVRPQGLSSARSSGSVTASSGSKPAPHASHIDAAVKDALMTPKVRVTVLRFCTEIEQFLNDPDQQVMTFSDTLSSYQRLLAHRVAQHYGLETTTIDAADSNVKVRGMKGPNTRMPQVKLASINSSNQSRWEPRDPAHANGDGAFRQHHPSNMKLLTSSKSSQRPPSANGTIAAMTPAQRPPDRSYKERQQDYERARSRIFPSGPDTPSSAPAAANSNSSTSQSAPTATTTATPIPTSAPAPVHASRPRLPNSNPKAPHLHGPGRDLSSGLSGASPPANSPGNNSHNSRRGPPVDGGDQKALFRNRDEEMRDPDFQRDHNRFQPNFAPTYLDHSAQGPGMYMQRSYNSEFPTLGGSPHQGGGMPIKGPMPPPGLPPGVQAMAGPHSLGMSFPGMPMLGPHMVPIGPDGTVMSMPNGMAPGYGPQMSVPYAVFPGMGGGMQIPHMQMSAAGLQGMMMPAGMQYGMPFHPGTLPYSVQRPGSMNGMEGLNRHGMQSMGMLPQGAVPVYGPAYAHPAQQMAVHSGGPRPSMTHMDRGAHGRDNVPQRGVGRNFAMASAHSGANNHTASQRASSAGSTGSSAPRQRPGHTVAPPAPPQAPPPTSTPASNTPVSSKAAPAEAEQH
ncbi:hypothetical protein WJX73_006072 [Symbiochloris irregularis]|uniref:SUZ domain-containing protein n=1 Tax=Symbiochloris irregularis TaxID=706552 RepID=A0AAW1P4W4_9CHLO